MKDDNLKQSNAGIEGGTNGSLGGATTADLQNGFIPEQPAVTARDWEMPMLYEEKPKDGGFVGRPEGWER